MTRKARIVSGILGGVVALLVLVSVLATILFPKDRAVEFALLKIQEATGRPVAVGTTDLKIFPRVGLSLEDMEFGESAKPGAPRVRADAAQLRVRILPLLSGRVEITEINLVRPDVEIVLADPSETPTPDPDRPAPGAGDAAPGLDIRIQRLTIDDGSLRVRLADGTPLVEMAGFSERLSASASANGDIDVVGISVLDTLQLHLPAGTLGEGLVLRLSKELHYRNADDALEFTKASLDVAGVPVSVTGRVTGLRAGAPVADLRFGGGPGDVATVLGLVPAGFFPEIDGMQSGGRLEIEGVLTGPLGGPDVPGFDLSLGLTDGHIRYPGLDRAIEEIGLTLRADPDRIEVEEFKARTGSSAMRANATFTEYRTDPHARLAIDTELDLGEVSSHRPAADSLALSGALTAKLIAEGRLNDPGDFSISGALAGSDVYVDAPAMRVPLRDADFDLVFDRDVVQMRHFTAGLGSSDLSIAGQLTNPLALNPAFESAERATGVLTIRSNRLDLDELFPPEEREKKEEGRPADATPPQVSIPELPPLDATISLSAGQMRVNRIEGENAGGTLVLKNGVLDLEQFSMAAFGGMLGLQGTMDVGRSDAPTFDMSVDVRDARMSGLFEHARGLQRFNIVGSELTGTLNASADMSGGLNEFMELDLPALASTGNVEVLDATLSGHPIQGRLSSFLDAPGFEKLAISKLFQSFRIEGGRLVFDEMSLHSTDLEVMGRGSSSLDGTYEMSLDLWMPPNLAEGIRDEVPAEIAALLFGGSERLMVPVAITGSRSERPSIRLDRQRLSAGARNAAEARLAEEKKRLEEDASRRLQEAITGQAAPDSVSLEESIGEEIEDRVKDALEGIFGKGKK